MCASAAASEGWLIMEFYRLSVSVSSVHIYAVHCDCIIILIIIMSDSRDFLLITVYVHVPARAI